MEVFARNCLWRKKLGAEVEELDEGRNSARNVLGMRTLSEFIAMIIHSIGTKVVKQTLDCVLCLLCPHAEKLRERAMQTRCLSFCLMHLLESAQTISPWNRA